MELIRDLNHAALPMRAAIFRYWSALATQCASVQNVVVLEMPNGDLRANSCMIRPVKFQQCIGTPVVSAFLYTVQ